MPERDDAYRDLFEHALSGVVRVRVLLDEPALPDILILEANDAVETLTGLRGVTGKRVSELLPSLRQDDPSLFALATEIATTGEPRRFETYVRSLDLWFSISAYSPARGEVVASFDVTNERRLAASLREREEWLRAIYMGSPLGIVRADLDGRILDANPAFLSTLGYEIEEIVGTPLRQLRHPEAAEEVHVRRALLEGKVPRARLESRWVRKDGAVIWIRLHLQPVRDASGEPRFLFGLAEDVTDRKRVAEELQRISREQEIILERASVGIVLVVGRTMVWVNRRMEELFGHSRAEMVGQSTRMFYASDEAFEAAGRGSVALLSKGRPFDVELELRRKGGEPLWVILNGSLIDPRDPGRGSLWIVTDRTAQRRADEALRQSEARLRSLFESHTAVMLLVDVADGTIIDANSTAAAFYGYPRERLLTMRVQDINALPPEDVRRRLDSASRSEGNDFVVPHRLADGTLRTVEVRSSPIEFGGRRLLFAIVQDVTEREEAQAALERERQRYLSLMKIAHDGIHLLDLDGNLVEANEAFLSMLGETPEAVGRLNVRDWAVTVGPEVITERLRAALERPLLFETRHRRKSGSLIDVEVSATSVELEGRRYLLAASRDITERKVLEQRLSRKRAELEALNRSLEERVRTAVEELRAKDQILTVQNRQAVMGEMVGNIAHQWRQPLNALALVLFNLRDLARRGELDAAAAEETVAYANRLIQKMATTIDDFRNFFRPTRERTLFSALDQARETIALVGPSFRQAGIDIDLDENEDHRVFGFPNEYSQVLLNLLSNARQAIEASGTLGGQVRIRLGARDGLTRLAVHDTGGGVPEELLDRIFEPYYSTKEGGTGIGLYMSRQIMERSFGGRLEVRNVDGGAEFSMLVPLAPPPQE